MSRRMACSCSAVVRCWVGYLEHCLEECHAFFNIIFVIQCTRIRIPQGSAFKSRNRIGFVADFKVNHSAKNKNKNLKSDFLWLITNFLVLITAGFLWFWSMPNFCSVGRTSLISYPEKIKVQL